MSTDFNTYKYWVISFLGDIENPQIIGLSGFENPINEETINNIYNDLVNHDDLQSLIPDGNLEKVKFGEITVELAKELINELNKIEK